MNNTAAMVAEWAPRGQLADAIRLYEGCIHRRWIDRYLPFCADGIHARPTDNQYIGGRAEEIIRAKQAGFTYQQIEKLFGSDEMHVVIAFVTLYGLTASQAMDLYRRDRPFFTIWSMRYFLERGASYELMLDYWRAFRAGELCEEVVSRYFDDDNDPQMVYDAFSNMSDAAKARMAEMSLSRTPLGLARHMLTRMRSDDNVNLLVLGEFARELATANITLDDRDIVEMAGKLNGTSLAQLHWFMPYVEKGLLPLDIAFDLVTKHELPFSNSHGAQKFMGTLEQPHVGLSELLDAMHTLNHTYYGGYLQYRREGMGHHEALIRCMLGGLFGLRHMENAGVSLPEGIAVLIAGGDIEEFVGVAGLTGISAADYLALRNPAGD